MSYCVNCGVKLEQSLTACPLCLTPVINPKELQTVPSASPFPAAKGEIETVKKRDLAIWMSLVLGATSLSCFVLNLTVYQGSRWSYPVIGACGLLWVLLLPLMFSDIVTWKAALICDATAIIAYQYMLSLLTPTQYWFFRLALPITLWTFFLWGLCVLLYKKVSRALLATDLYFFMVTGLLCVGIELLIRQYAGQTFLITWSAIVFSVCFVICVALLAILSLAGLRNTVRKRLHF